MAFNGDKPLQVNSRLWVKLVLKPANVNLAFSATVVACEIRPSDESHPYLLRIAIDEGNRSAQEQLIQHVVQRQYAMLGAQNGGG